jgi:PAS domain S-box-containing protein
MAAVLSFASAWEWLTSRPLLAVLVCVLLGLLWSMYSLFRKADRSAAELARVNAALAAQARERELAEQERDRFFDMSLDMLCIAGTDGYFKQLNAAWEKTLGYTLEELMARPYVEFVHPEDRGSTGRESQRLRLGGHTFDFENRYLAKDGTYRWLSWRSAAFPERGLIYAVARDVNERKKVEQMKNDFISVVSHELRTPLTSIRGSLGLIAGGVAGEIPEKARALVEIATKNSERLVRLINDMLDVEKIESGEMIFRFVPVEVMPLLEQAVEANRAFAASYEAELRIAEAAPGARVRADPDRILQVLTNLLSNAVKFSPRGETVEVAVSRKKSQVSVAVTDRGRGIPSEFQSRVFEKFAQADTSSTREKEGTGLGLSISKAIVESHGGRIGFETGNGGTTFRFELPEWGEPRGAEKESGPRILICEDGRDAARILHVEDDSDLQKVVAAIVNGDAAMEQAANLEEAQRWLVREHFDLVILDLALPDGSGAELLPLLGRLAPPTPVLIFSAYAVDPSIASGVASVLVKSQTTNEELLERIRSVLARTSAPGSAPR